MSADFDRLIAVAEQSRAGGLSRWIAATLHAAWQSSWLGGALRDARAIFTNAAAPERLRWCALVIAIGAGGHAILRLAMPATVVPATPGIVPIGIAVMAALVAWQPAAFHRAWPASRLSRAFGRGVRVDDAD